MPTRIYRGNNCAEFEGVVACVIVLLLLIWIRSGTKIIGDMPSSNPTEELTGGLPDVPEGVT